MNQSNREPDMSTVLTDDQIEECYSDKRYLFARAIEQAVLQSPEIRALRKDAEILRWLRDNGLVSFPTVRDWMTIRVVRPMPPDVATFDEAISAAMEKQP